MRPAEGVEEGEGRPYRRARVLEEDGEDGVRTRRTVRVLLGALRLHLVRREGPGVAGVGGDGGVGGAGPARHLLLEQGVGCCIGGRRGCPIGNEGGAEVVHTGGVVNGDLDSAPWLQSCTCPGELDKELGLIHPLPEEGTVMGAGGFHYTKGGEGGVSGAIDYLYFYWRTAIALPSFRRRLTSGA